MDRIQQLCIKKQLVVFPPWWTRVGQKYQMERIKIKQNFVSISLSFYNDYPLLLYLQYLGYLMISSRKGDFRINLKLYSSVKSSCPRSRMTAPVCLLPKAKQNPVELSNNHCDPSILEESQDQQFRRIWKKTLTFYNRNMEFYRLNEHKLMKAVENEMRQKNYLYQNTIARFIRSKENLVIKPSINPQKLLQQLEQLNKFLEDLYEKKKIKEIVIINENLKEEEKSIVEKVGSSMVDSIYGNLQLSEYFFCNDFIEQYQNICAKFGVPEPYLQSHIHIRDQIENSRQDVINHFEAKKKSRANQMHENRRQI